MAETIPGGAYKVGDKYLDAHGVETQKPSGQVSKPSEPLEPDTNTEPPLREPEKVAARTDFDAESATLPELKAEAERRRLEVRRGDGQDGAPLKADYVAALS